MGVRDRRSDEELRKDQEPNECFCIHAVHFVMVTYLRPLPFSLGKAASRAYKASIDDQTGTMRNFFAANRDQGSLAEFLYPVAAKSVMRPCRQHLGQRVPTDSGDSQGFENAGSSVGRIDVAAEKRFVVGVEDIQVGGLFHHRQPSSDPINSVASLAAFTASLLRLQTMISSP